jgi:hypothetical protein
VSENPPSQAPSCTPILPPAEAERRLVLLSKLQSALAAHGVESVLARNHRLILHGDRSAWAPSGLTDSGLTDPQLHIFLPEGTEVATADGRTYRFASGDLFPGGDPAAVAAVIRFRRGHHLCSHFDK